MSTIDMLILGILLDSPMNAYELTHFVEKKQVTRLIKISTPAIYKSCKRMFKAGYLEGKTTRDGESPEKVIYSVNQKGRDYFYKLMNHFSGNFKPFFIEFNSFVWNIELIERNEALHMLENLKNELVQIKDWIIIHEKEAATAPFPARMIVKQYRMVIITLGEWISQTIKEFKTINNID